MFSLQSFLNAYEGKPGYYSGFIAKVPNSTIQKVGSTYYISQRVSRHKRDFQKLGYDFVLQFGPNS